jgi:hypothetical protein
VDRNISGLKCSISVALRRLHNATHYVSSSLAPYISDFFSSKIPYIYIYIDVGAPNYCVTSDDQLMKKLN